MEILPPDPEPYDMTPEATPPPSPSKPTLESGRRLYERMHPRRDQATDDSEATPPPAGTLESGAALYRSTHPG